MSALPAWVLALLARAQQDRLTGFVTLSFRHGDIRHVKVERVVFAPQSDDPVCPRGCGPMEGYDWGQAFKCAACGAKRTLSQVRQARPDSA